MGERRDFVVDRSDFSHCRWVSREPSPEAVELAPGQVLVAVERFALTANNISYAVTGESLGYWNYFPTPEEGGGIIPAFGYAEVVRSEHDDIGEGERLYGYLPMATHLVMQPEGVSDRGFLDQYEQRRELHPIYNTYARVGSEAGDPDREDLQPLLRPLFTTSFLLDDFLRHHDFFGASQVILLSASSKTAIALAFCLGHGEPSGVEVVGLTSDGNRAFVEGLGCYDRVLGYDELGELDSETPTAVVDMAGNGPVLAAVHRHFGERLVHSSLVGKSHWQEEGPPAELPGARPAFFFAPDHLRQRIGEWGQEELDRRLAASWKAFAEAASDWFSFERASGPEAIERAFREVLAGRVDPSRGLILSP